MINEKFLQAMDGLDEKFVREADRDVNFWLNSMEGEAVEAGNVKRSSPWKVMTAAVVAAAAVFGAAVITNNVTDRPKPDVSASSSVPLSEQLANYTIENLNFDTTVYFDNTPNSGKWQRLEYEMPPFGEKSAESLKKVASKYGVTVDRNDIMVAEKDDVSGWIDTPLSEADFDNKHYWGMYYDSDELYIQVIPSVTNWIELSNKKNMKNVAGAEEVGFGQWRPSDGRVSEQFVDPANENKTCVLDGKTVKIADALRNAEKMIAESDLFPKEFDAEIVGNVGLYTYENGNQGLWIEVAYSFDGVQYLAPTTLGFDESKSSNQTYMSSVYIGMLTEKSLDWVWQFKGFAAVEPTHRDCEVSISQEDALKLVSMELERSCPNTTFSVREVQLVYADRITKDGKLCIEPTWLVYFSRSDEWFTERRSYAFVSAVDGNVYIIVDRSLII